MSNQHPLRIFWTTWAHAGRKRAACHRQLTFSTSRGCNHESNMRSVRLTRDQDLSREPSHLLQSCSQIKSPDMIASSA